MERESGPCYHEVGMEIQATLLVSVDTILEESEKGTSLTVSKGRNLGSPLGLCQVFVWRVRNALLRMHIEVQAFHMTSANITEVDGEG